MKQLTLNLPKILLDFIKTLNEFCFLHDFFNKNIVVQPDTVLPGKKVMFQTQYKTGQSL